MIPKEAMKEIEKAAKEDWELIDEICDCAVIPSHMKRCYQRAATFGYELAREKQPPASGREWGIQIKNGKVLGAFDGLMMGAENVHVREVTPQDEAREKAVQGLVESLEGITGDECDPSCSCTCSIRAEKALADWEKLK